MVPYNGARRWRLGRPVTCVARRRHRRSVGSSWVGGEPVVNGAATLKRVNALAAWRGRIREITISNDELIPTLLKSLGLQRRSATVLGSTQPETLNH